MAGIDHQRREHRLNLRQVVRVQRGPRLLAQIGHPHDPHARRVQIGNRAAGGLFHFAQHHMGLLAHPRQRFARQQAVGRFDRHARRDLPVNACHTHHEKLIQIAAADGRVFQALQQRIADILGLGQHPLVEGQPRQLTVQKGAVRQRAGAVGFALGRFFVLHGTSLS